MMRPKKGSSEEPIEMDIKFSPGDLDFQFIKAIARGDRIEGLIEVWLRKKFQKLAKGEALNHVFPSIGRAHQKTKTIDKTLTILSHYIRLRKQGLTHETITQKLSKELILGEDTIKKAWQEWGKFL